METHPFCNVIILSVLLAPLIIVILRIISITSLKETKCTFRDIKDKDRAFAGCKIGFTVEYLCDNKNETDKGVITESCGITSKMFNDKYSCYVKSCDDEVRIETERGKLPLIGYIIGLIFIAPLSLSIVFSILKKTSTTVFARSSPSSEIHQRQTQIQPQPQIETEPIRIMNVNPVDFHILNPASSVSANGLSRRENGEKLKQQFDNMTISSEEMKKLHADGWSCCICLEEVDFAELNPVLHLKCNHYVHAECMSGWINKGHTVCCLCKEDLSKEST